MVYYIYSDNSAGEPLTFFSYL